MSPQESSHQPFVAPRIPSYEFRMLLQAQRDRLMHADRRDEQRLQDIDRALARIKRGTYGVCIHCCGEIGRARLKADPTAEHCLACDAPA